MIDQLKLLSLAQGREPGRCRASGRARSRRFCVTTAAYRSILAARRPSNHSISCLAGVRDRKTYATPCGKPGHGRTRASLTRSTESARAPQLGANSLTQFGQCYAETPIRILAP